MCVGGGGGEEEYLFHINKAAQRWLGMIHHRPRTGEKQRFVKQRKNKKIKKVLT